MDKISTSRTTNWPTWCELIRVMTRLDRLLWGGVADHENEPGSFFLGNGESMWSAAAWRNSSGSSKLNFQDSSKVVAVTGEQINILPLQQFKDGVEWRQCRLLQRPQYLVLQTKMKLDGKEEPWKDIFLFEEESRACLGALNELSMRGYFKHCQCEMVTIEYGHHKKCYLTGHDRDIFELELCAFSCKSSTRKDGEGYVRGHTWATNASW